MEQLSYDELKLAYDELVDKYYDNLGAFEKLNTELADTFEQRNNYRNKYSQLMDDYDEVMADLDITRGQREELKKQIVEINTNYSEFIKMYDKREKEHAEELSILKRPLTPSQEELKDKCEELTRDYVNLSKESAEANKEADRWRSKYSDLIDDYEEAMESYSTLNAEYNHLQQSAKSSLSNTYSEKEYEEIRQYNLELAEKIAKLTTDNYDLSRKVDGMEKEYKRLFERDIIFRKMLRELL